MSLRLGFVGCGKWGRKLAESFRACGAEVVAHDRSNRISVAAGHCQCGHSTAAHDSGGDCRGLIGDKPCECGPGKFGRLMPWRSQLTDKSIDAIIAVAPPEITTEVALACAEAGRAVMATKPLFDHPATIRAPFYVDFWRLWSEAHAAPLPLPGAPADLAMDGNLPKRGELDFELHGCGPYRDFPGALDWGPHAMAAAIDRYGGAIQFDHAERIPCEKGESFRAWFRDVSGRYLFWLYFGNGDPPDGFPRPTRVVWGHVETPTHIGTEPKDEVIQKMCKSFIADVQEGFVDARLLNLSREGMRLLRQIRENAG